MLRNLVPAQLLMGKSSFNSGDSLSAGLPKYARSRIKAIADMMERNKQDRSIEGLALPIGTPIAKYRAFWPRHSEQNYKLMLLKSQYDFELS